MGKPACSLRTKLIALVAAGLLACGLAPSISLADDSVAGGFTSPEYENDARSASPNSAPNESQQVSASQDVGASRVAPMLASGLFGSPAAIISSDVALDAADPIVGSFTVDSLTYAINDDNATLVAVSSDLQQVTDSQDADDSRVAPMLASGQAAIPASVTYNDTTYPVTAIGSYAFYLSGTTSVDLSDSILSVDDRAFRSSDVERIEVDPANPNFASFDGCLYDSQLLRLLLIPEGRKGSVLLSCETEVVEASLFSHCSLVEAIAVEEGGAAFSSWNDCLYTADGMTLLRVPAGATDITIRDGCATIAAGAMEGCAKLDRINAPASVTFISPDLFESVPTVGLPAQMAVQDETTSGVASALADQVKESADSSGAEGEAEVSPRRVVASSQGLEAPLALPDLGSTSASPSSEASGSAPQLTAMVALSSADDDLPEVDPSSIEVALPRGIDAGAWRAAGFSVVESSLSAQASKAAIYAAAPYTFTIDANGGKLIRLLRHRDDRIAGNVYSLIGKEALESPSDSVGIYSWEVYPGPDSNLPDEFDSVPHFCTAVTGPGTFVPPKVFDFYSYYAERVGYSLLGFNSDPDASVGLPLSWGNESDVMFYALWQPHTYAVTFNLNGVSGAVPSSIAATYDQDLTLPSPEARPGYRFLGWNTAADGSGTTYQAGAVRNLTADDGATVTLYAQWERVNFDIGFDVDSEPGDADYPGDKKDDQTVNKDSGAVEIEDPKRPGYIFEGWVIPNAGGTEAVDQDLVYQGDDGKWYVDASKLPDYAGDDGRVELTARWTSVISVDVPSSVTFYADLVTQGQESREGAASGGEANGAFGQSKVENQSEIDLRVVGLESSAVKTEGSTLGADSILKKADAATPSTSTQKLLSLYPSTKQWKPEDLQDPDAVGGTKAATAVDFDLDDILLEKSFKADDFTIAAGGTLNMGYRLNLSETGQQLDYDKLSTLSEGQSASIANVSYTFAGDAPLGPAPSGDETDPLYVTVDEAFITANGLSGKAQPGIYGLADIKAAADDIASKVTVEPPASGATADQVAEYWSTVQQQASTSNYYALYKALLDKQVMDGGGTGYVAYGAGPYFQLKVSGATGNGYLPVQLIGICQDTKSSGGKAGLTFQMRDVYALSNKASATAGGGTFNTYMNSDNVNTNGWGRPAHLRNALTSTFWGYLPASVQSAIAPVDKYQQLPGGTTDAYLQKTTEETVWLPSMYEAFGTSFANYNESEALTSVSGYAPFQYMAYQGNAGSYINTHAAKGWTSDGAACAWWLRSAYRIDTRSFGDVSSQGSRGSTYANSAFGVAPCFCL